MRHFDSSKVSFYVAFGGGALPGQILQLRCNCPLKPGQDTAKLAVTENVTAFFQWAMWEKMSWNEAGGSVH